MKKLSTLLLAVFLLTSGNVFAQGAKDVSDARAATEHFMKLMDAEEYSAAWSSGAESVRNDMPKLAWNLLATTVHLPLGTLKSRRYKSANVKPATITFDYVADYTNNRNVQESVTTVREKDGVWRVSGYGILADDKKPSQ